jgi:uncharacterized membrane protein YcaP (DUF421 family)
MENFFDTSFPSLVIICINAVGIYAAVIVFTRIAGKRSFSKMSSFDFAMTVAIGSILASTVLSSSVTLLEGVVGMAAVYLLQITAAFFRRYELFSNLIDNKPLLLMDGPTILQHNLKKARVTNDDLRAKLREANVIDLSQVRAVVYETTGDISVLHSANQGKTLDDWLLKDVYQ